MMEHMKNNAESTRRRQNFFETIKKRQNEIKAGKTRVNISVKSVVREFQLIDKENPIVVFLNRLFQVKRKLAPVVRERVPVSAESIR